MLAAALLLAGCGADRSQSEAVGLRAAGGGGTLAYAVSRVPATLDPLAAKAASAGLIVRQIHEPLGGSLRGPYGQGEREPGLVVSARSSADRRVWTLELRSGVRFADGTPFNASAVVVNARRWRSTRAGRALLPELFAVDAPRPDQVRFLLDAAIADLPKRLAAPQLGVVSPLALEPRSGEGARVNESASGTGTGPFESGARGADQLSLSRHAAWWGSDLGLGPALDGVAFLAAGAEERLRLLRAGEVQAAGPLSRAAIGKLESDPLLRAVGSPPTIGLAAAVRGLRSAVQPLSGVWLTTVGD